MTRVQQHGATPQRMPLADVLSNQGIDGLRLGTARPFPLWRLRSDPVRPPSIQNIRERHSDHVPPGPNTWTLNIQAAWSVPHPRDFLLGPIHIAQQCGPSATTAR